jgi:hypothetical protein
MSDKNRSGTDRQTRYEDLAGLLMAVSVITRKLARKLLALSQEAGERRKGRCQRRTI